MVAELEVERESLKGSSGLLDERVERVKVLAFIDSQKTGFDRQRHHQPAGADQVQAFDEEVIVEAVVAPVVAGVVQGDVGEGFLRKDCPKRLFASRWAVART